VRVTVTHPRSAEAALRVPRTDVVIERSDDGRFVAERGPFSHYERCLHVDGDHVVETTEFHLAVPFWWFLFVLPFRSALRRPAQRRSRRPWWAPPEPLDQRASTVLGLLCLLVLIDGFVGTLLTQTLTYAAREFGVDRGGQGTVLAVARVGALVALGAGVLSDRLGRRRPIVVCAAGACVFAALGSVAPHVAWLTVTQVAAAGCAGALGVLVAIVSAEEVPAGSRAYAYSLIIMTGGLGAGICVWALPLADTGTRGWRWIYAIAIVGLALVAPVARRLPESRRFAPELSGAPRGSQPTMADHGRRFWLLAAAGFLIASFASPAFQFQNDFLRQDRGFSAARIALFTVVTGTPAGASILAGGRLADVRGRRLVGATGILGGAAGTVGMFAIAGWPMWGVSIAGSVVGGFTVPALGVYRPELFPTALRGRAAGALEVIGVSGSAAGLLFVGSLADRWGSYAGPIALASIATIFVVVLVLVLFPETAQRSLEELNPEDRPPR